MTSSSTVADPTSPAAAATPRVTAWWDPSSGSVDASADAFAAGVDDTTRTLVVVESDGLPAVATGGALSFETERPAAEAQRVLAIVPPCSARTLGDAGFKADHGLEFAYVAGAMANGIGSEDVVAAMGRAGLVGFYGAAGLPVARVEAAIDRIQSELGDRPYGANLIHSPNEPALEEGCADLYIRRGVSLVSASAYLDLTLPLVRYRLHGIRQNSDGSVATPHRVIGKVSRVEVASKFLGPAPGPILDELVRRGDLTREQAELATRVPVAQDLTAEADSGGHTDNRPALALLPTMLSLRDRLQAEHSYDRPLRIGAAGGIATPDSVAAAFALGAAFVLTGSVNQACVEAGTSDAVRQMLAEAQQADVIMAPAADMFEMGVKVQVLKRGTLFAMRAAKLFELYRARGGLHELSAGERATLEKTIFRKSLDEVWTETQAFFRERDARQIDRAARDPKHQMALVFRWYLGQSSHWANTGVADRRIDYQVWCGPSMGAFNEWTAGTFLADAAERNVETVALNLLDGAAVRTRMASLRSQGVVVPAGVGAARPRRLEELRERVA